MEPWIKFMEIRANWNKLLLRLKVAELEKDECAIIIHKATIKVVGPQIEQQLTELLAIPGVKEKVRCRDAGSGYIGPFSQLEKV